MTTARILKTSTRHDDITGDRIVVKRRWFRELTKAGQPHRGRRDRAGQQMLITYPDGSWRYYSHNGILARERVTKARFAAECGYSSDLDD